MYLRLRKRRKPTDAPPSNTSPPHGTGDERDTTGRKPTANGADPAQPSSTDWVEPDSAQADPADGTDIGSGKHPNRGKAQESTRGSHR